jgi:hypothetical protein
MGRKKIRRGPGQREIGAKDFRLTGEVRYIQHRAANFDARFVTINPLALFSTDTGDAWLLDPADHFAARIARDGAAEPIHFAETDTNFAIEWKGSYRVERDIFVYIDGSSGRIVSVLGYPTARIAELG